MTRLDAAVNRVRSAAARARLSLTSIWVQVLSVRGTDALQLSVYAVVR